MKTKMLLLIVFILCLSPIAAAHAQDDVEIIPIFYGDTVEGTLASVEQGNIYTFVGSAGDQVSIYATSPKVDLYLRLADMNATILTENDNINASTRDAQIDYTLPETGLYYFAVVGYTTGNYTVSLNLNNAPQPTPTQQQEQTEDLFPIAYGETVNGTLANADDGVVYSFSGSAGDQITLQASSSKVDVYLWLGDAQANELATNDDISAQDLNAQIDYTLPSTGNYLVVVMGYSAGPYSLTLTNNSSTSQQSEDLFPIAYGDTVSGTLANADDGVVYSFSGNAGDKVTISASSATVDMFLWLGDGEANQLATNDDISAQDLNAQIDFTLPAAGDYLIVVMGYSAGSYELTLTSSSAAASTNQMGQLPTPGKK